VTGLPGAGFAERSPCRATQTYGSCSAVFNRKAPGVDGASLLHGDHCTPMAAGVILSVRQKQGSPLIIRRLVSARFLRGRVAARYADLKHRRYVGGSSSALAVLCSAWLFFAGRYGRLGHKGEQAKNVHQLEDYYRTHQGWLGAPSHKFHGGGIVLVAPSTEAVCRNVSAGLPRCALITAATRDNEVAERRRHTTCFRGATTQVPMSADSAVYSANPLPRRHRWCDDSACVIDSGSVFRNSPVPLVSGDIAAPPGCHRTTTACSS
jgi:hypothetical protein